MMKKNVVSNIPAPGTITNKSSADQWTSKEGNSVYGANNAIECSHLRQW